MFLFPAERLILRIIAALLLIDVVMIVHKGLGVDLPGYAGSVGCGLLMVMFGQLYRVRRPNERIASALTAAGLFILFSIAGSIFNYMFLPIAFEPIDPLLFKVDAMLGYSWPGVVTWAATYPWIGKLLFVVYATSLPQLLLIVLALGFTGKYRMLHHFLLTGVIGALLSIAFWVCFPTFGAKAYHALPQWVSQTIPMAVDPAYGQELMRLGREGVTYLTPKNVLGLIGFPSFHIFMACMSVFFVPRHVVPIVIIGTLNVLMLPAVLVQGGHHLSDVFGGMMTFAGTCWLAGRLLRLLEGTASLATPQASVVTAAE